MPRTWGQVTKGRIGEKDPNILELGAQTQIRPLDNVIAAWEQHVIEDPKDDQQVVFVTCPGLSCPLCRKPTDPDGEAYFKRSSRFATNVWSYKDNAVKVLIGGKMIFEQFDKAQDVGIDPQACDWVIHKVGERRQTEYTLIRMDAAPFQFPVTPEMLHDVTKFEQPATAEQIFAELEKMGIDYDALPIPSFDYDEALAWVLPFGQHKGLTIEQLLAQDEQYAEWLHGDMLAKGKIGESAFQALQTVLHEMGKAAPLEEIVSAAAAAPPTGGNLTVGGGLTPSAPPLVAQTPTPANSMTVDLVNKATGEVQNFPTEAMDALLATGSFERFVEPQPEPAAPAGPVTLIAPDGTPGEYPPEAATALLAAGFTEATEVAPEPAAPPAEVPDEAPVDASIGGNSTTIPFGTAVGLMNQGVVVEFADPEVDRYAQTKLEFNQRQGPPPQPSAVGKAMGESAVQQLHQDAAAEAAGGPPLETAPAAADPDKPFVCPWNDGKAYKTQGALTQHLNKEHGGAQAAGATPAAPVAATAPASGNGGTGASASTLEEVKAMLAVSPVAKDYQQLLALFAEVASGKRRLDEFDDAELEALKVKLATG